MNKLFGLFLLALACWAPSSAFAVTCFWVGGTATWDTNNTGGGGTGGIKWASASGGGTTCAGGGTGGSPSTGDAATFDAASGGGTVTVNTTVAIQTIDMSAFTGTLDFAPNDNNVTLSGASAFINTGSGTRTLNMGDGTWTLSAGTALWNCQGNTNFTLNANGSTIAFTGTATSSNRRFLGGAKTYNIVTVNSSTNFGFTIGQANTFATLTISAPNRIEIPTGSTQTITTLTNISGSSSGPVMVNVGGYTNGIGTLAVTNNFTGDWMGFQYVTFSGGTHSATNSLNFGNNNGITITPPSGGGGGGRIIGG